MIERKLTPELIQRAWDESNNMKVYNNSYRKGNANFVGLLGEMVAEEWFNENQLNFIGEKTTEHDYRISHDNRTIDVKTKDRTVDPRDNYDCSIPLYNKRHQIPDYYLFVSLTRDKKMDDNDPMRFKKAFILGAANQFAMHKFGLIWRKGQIDPSNKTKFWTDCLNVYINQLTPPEEAASSWQESRPEVKVWTQRILHKLKTQGQEAICSTGFQDELRHNK